MKKGYNFVQKVFVSLLRNFGDQTPSEHLWNSRRDDVDCVSYFNSQLYLVTTYWCQSGMDICINWGNSHTGSMQTEDRHHRRSHHTPEHTAHHHRKDHHSSEHRHHNKDHHASTASNHSNGHNNDNFEHHGSLHSIVAVVLYWNKGKALNAELTSTHGLFHHRLFQEVRHGKNMQVQCDVFWNRQARISHIWNP